jgi:hypothetical protein
VEHSERLQAVNPHLAPGELFDPANLPVLPDNSPANQWYQVPRWLAGKWHKDNQTDYFRFDYATKQTDTSTRVEEAKSDGIWGTQADSEGRIWQFNPAPFTTTVDAGNQIVVQIVRLSEPIQSSDACFVRRAIDTQIRVDRDTNIIRSVESGEQITSYIQESDGLVKRETSAKVFDKDGQPVLLGKSFAYEKRVADFSPQDSYEGKDLRALFQQFLSNTLKTSRKYSVEDICFVSASSSTSPAH